MLTSSNKERLEQEIANLINFISEGRSFFFKKSGGGLNSSDDFLNHFVSKDLFNAHPELKQLELNIQLLYIKLAAYYELVSKDKIEAINWQRNAFAHATTDLIFNRRAKYHFFLHKVSHNFKKIRLIFVEETEAEDHDLQDSSKVLDLDLNKDINDFLFV